MNSKPSLFCRTRGVLPALFLCALWIAVTPGRVGAQNPEGTWDFVVTGQDQGVATITFLDDLTLVGHMIVTPRFSTNVAAPSAVFFGFVVLEGFWRLDERGRLFVGFRDDPEADEFVPAEFSGTLQGRVRGSRMSLLGTTTNGRTRLTGRFSDPGQIPDLTGDRLVQGRFLDSQGVMNPFFETVTLEPTSSGPGLFSISGQGPGYILQGFVLVTAQRRVGIFLVMQESSTSTEAFGRSMVGTLNRRTFTTSTSGFMETGGDTFNRASMRMFQ